MNDTLRIREIAPTVWVVQCPVRGTYSTVFTSRYEARKNVWTAASAPHSRWATDEQARAALVRFGFIAERPQAEGLTL